MEKGRSSGHPGGDEVSADNAETDQGKHARTYQHNLRQDNCVPQPRYSFLHQDQDRPIPNLVDREGDLTRSCKEALSTHWPWQDLVGQEAGDVGPCYRNIL